MWNHIGEELARRLCRLKGSESQSLKQNKR